MYSTARQHSFTRVHVALKDKAHRVHAIVWQVTTGACGLAYCCPCPARHAGTMGEGPASAARVQNGSAAAKGCAPHPPPPPQHMRHRGRASAPAWGARTGANPAKPQPLALAAPSGPALPTGAQPHSRPPPPPRPSTPHRNRCRAPGGADPAVGPAAAGPPQHACSHTGWKHNLGTQGGAQKVGAPSLAARRPQADTPERGRLARAAELGRPRRTTRTDKIALGASQPGRQKRRD